MNVRCFMTELPVSAERAFRWHQHPGALMRLMPPWESVQIIHSDGGIQDGAELIMVTKIGPFRVRWIAHHYDFQSGRQFRDKQLQGPFAHWDHTHRFVDCGETRCRLEDDLQFRLPGGIVGQFLGGRFVSQKIEKMFDYRHATTAGDLNIHAKYENHKSLHVAITGSRGLVGSQLMPLLTTGGHKVTQIVRGSAESDQISWDPTGGELRAEALDGIDAVVHLAGENIAARRWNAKQKKKIIDSRVEGTRLLCESLAKMANPPKTLVSASATGFYGDRGDELLDESSDPGDGFLAEVVKQWEGATQAARDAGIRVVNLRFGMILSPAGGALEKMLLPFKLGGGGRVGSGKQYWSWVSIDDAVGAILHSLFEQQLNGPVNAVTDQPVTNAEFTRTLGRVLSRPTIIPLPAFAARLVLGEMADELILASTRVKPQQLIDSDYQFRHSDLEEALRHLLGR